jgi:hypothetical protein
MNFMFQKVTNMPTIHKWLSHSGAITRVSMFEAFCMIHQKEENIGNMVISEVLTPVTMMITSLEYDTM